MARSVPEIVEEQLAHWRAERQLAPVSASSTRRQPDVVVISREVGTEAGAIGSLVSELLHLSLYDHEFTEHIAKTGWVHRRLRAPRTAAG